MATTPTYQFAVTSSFPEDGTAQPSANTAQFGQAEFSAAPPAQAAPTAVPSAVPDRPVAVPSAPNMPQSYGQAYPAPRPSPYPQVNPAYAPGYPYPATYVPQEGYPYPQPVAPAPYPPQAYVQAPAQAYAYTTTQPPQPQNAAQPAAQPSPQSETFDFTYVHTPARIAVYDDLLAEPRIINIPPAPTTDFIGNLAATIYQEAQQAGGKIAYTVILQVTENFIHARFSEMVVSIYNNGNTIRFSDQGPGIKNKTLAVQPGFSSATQQMKQYIKGVGSGLPTVKEWLETNKGKGTLEIEDNLDGGSIVTLSLNEAPELTTPAALSREAFRMPPLTEKEKSYLLLLHKEGALRVTDFAEYTGISKGTVSAGLSKLQEYRLITNEEGTKRRVLTDLGKEAVTYLLQESANE